MQCGTGTPDSDHGEPGPGPLDLGSAPWPPAVDGQLVHRQGRAEHRGGPRVHQLRPRRRTVIEQTDYIGYHTGAKNVQVDGRGGRAGDARPHLLHRAQVADHAGGRGQQRPAAHRRHLEQDSGRGARAGPRIPSVPDRSGADSSSSSRSRRGRGSPPFSSCPSRPSRLSFGYKPGIRYARDRRLSLDRYREALADVLHDVTTPPDRDLGTLICLVIGIPMAYWMAVKVSPRWRTLPALVIIPFWTNFLVRTIGWQVILAPRDGCPTAADHRAAGVRSRSCTPAGVSSPVSCYNYLPLMILPLFVAFDRVGPALRRPHDPVPTGSAPSSGDPADGATGHHRRGAARLHPAHGRLHHRHRPRWGPRQHGRPARREPVPDRAELGARLGHGRPAHPHHRRHGSSAGCCLARLVAAAAPAQGSPTLEAIPVKGRA